MIYLDNASTTFPKPEEVYKANDYCARNLAFNGPHKKKQKGCSHSQIFH